MSAKKGQIIDHMNRNGLDNRKKNLRFVTNSQNLFNGPAQINSSTGVRGVGWDKKRKTWRARIRIDGKEKFLGRFDTIEEASIAYQNAAKLPKEDKMRNEKRQLCQIEP